MAVTDAAIDRIKEMIVSGELAPGARLPKEADLAERLGLSRNSLREAVRALALINVLDVRQGDGTYVTSLEPRLLLDALSFVADFHRDETVLEFFQVRRILEPSATGLAAVHMDDAAVRELRAILDELPQEPSAEDLAANDLRFHRRIAEGSGNAVLAALLESLSGPATRARVWHGLTQDGAAARLREQHTAIYTAIASRQPDVARAWATVHVAGVEEWLRRPT
ncbi:GntR family transcriptional regulator [Sphaerisporangium krabiense]|uniref:DNA-binding FadR family transcriptional regulator n=1 Tax=Sphaerisporangium krabiense TaxID=763782 RepID=A0A7W8Z5D8_9ACTN|nr:FadR/GntR family transcriptional regulator [Sphaerisporangium krabiense]MBB5627739.1 DNA-binding FadR family transcriptional regulator [Sphaerisporangium krabiense]GII61897.1 GntR family transcriptional regulator [Sphaerisporangium krabiense]